MLVQDLPLKTESEFYRKNISQINEEYTGKYIIIVGEEVVKSDTDKIAIYKWALKKHGLGNFLLQKCEGKKTQNVRHLRFPIKVVIPSS